MELMSEYPVGRCMFFMTAGHVANFTIKAGYATEPMPYPTWAEVVEEDKELFVEVANQIWESVLQDKKTFHVEFSEDILRVFEYEIGEEGCGTGDLMIGPWVEGATASRYLIPYYMYNIVKLAQDSNLSLERIRQHMHLTMSKALGTAEMSGMKVLADLARRTIACVDEMENRDEVLELLNALYLYGSSINAWQNYRIKWGLNQAFIIPTRKELVEMGKRAGESYI